MEGASADGLPEGLGVGRGVADGRVDGVAEGRVDGAGDALCIDAGVLVGLLGATPPPASIGATAVPPPPLHPPNSPARSKAKTE